MEQYSWDDISHSTLKNFTRKLCTVFSKHTERDQYAHELSIEKAPTEKILRAKIKQLQEELEQTRKEKDIALDENRKKIDELNLALLSIKTQIREIINYKKERNRRLKALEKKIK